MRKISLTKAAIKTLRPALSGAIGTIKREIATGVSQLYQTADNNLLVVARPEGDQLVIVAVAGSRLYQSRGEIINFARLNHFKSIRFHTKVPERLTRALEGLPFVLIDERKSLLGANELVYQLELNNGW